MSSASHPALPLLPAAPLPDPSRRTWLAATAAAVKKAVLANLAALKKIPLDALTAQRYAKFSAMGRF